MVTSMSAAPLFVTQATLNTAGQYVCWAGVAPQDMTIPYVGFKCGAVVGTPTGEVSVQSLSLTDGTPSADIGGGSPTAATFSPTQNAWNQIALTNSTSVTKGSAFGLMVKFSSGTTSFIVQSINNLNLNISSLPYQVVNTGTPTVARASTMTICAGSSATATYPLFCTLPGVALTGGAFNNTSADRKRGMQFTLPFKARVIGVQWYNTNSTGDFNVIIEDNAGNELSLSSTALDGNVSAASTGAVMKMYFDNTVTLVAGTTYRCVVQPTSATNVNVQAVQASNATYINSGFPGLGSSTFVVADSTPTYTNNTDQVPLMDLILDQIDDGTGSGSGGHFVGMNGGMNG